MRAGSERGAPRRPAHVNGVAHDVAVPARRLLSDALRHDLGLTGTHVGCEHGVCGACTVLLDGRPMRSCLMFAVSAVDCRDHHRRGADRGRRLARARCSRRSRVPRPAVRLLHAGVPHHDHGRPRGEPVAHRGRGPRHDRRQPVPLHRLPEHREVGAARRRTCRQERVDDDQAVRRGVQRVEDQRFLRGQGRYVDDVAVGPAHPARRGAALAARPRPRSSRSTSTTCSTSRACTRSGPTRTWPTCPRRWPSRCRC